LGFFEACALREDGPRVFSRPKKGRLVRVESKRGEGEEEKNNLFLSFLCSFWFSFLVFLATRCCCFAAAMPAEAHTFALSAPLSLSLSGSLEIDSSLSLLLALAQLLAQPLLLRLGELGAVLVPRRGGHGGGDGSGRGCRPRGGRGRHGDGAGRRRSGGGGAPVRVGSGARRRRRGAEELGRDLAVGRPLSRGSPAPPPAAAAAGRVAPTSSSAAAGGAVAGASAAAAAGLRVVVARRRRLGGRGGGRYARLQPRDVSVLVGEVEVLSSFIFSCSKGWWW